jgi:hypothetical protein
MPRLPKRGIRATAAVFAAADNSRNQPAVERSVNRRTSYV